MNCPKLRVIIIYHVYVNFFFIYLFIYLFFLVSIIKPMNIEKIGKFIIILKKLIFIKLASEIWSETQGNSSFY